MSHQRALIVYNICKSTQADLNRPIRCELKIDE